VAFVFRRKGIQYWWMCWTDAEGKEERESSKFTDRDKAQALVEEIDRQERAKARRKEMGALTVEKFFDDTWVSLRRRRRPFAWRSDMLMLKAHFLPAFGSRAVADLATDEGEVELLDWLLGLREHKSKRDGTPIAPRTVRNVASVVRVFFADAMERKAIRKNPTATWDADRHLPPIEDKKRGWRSLAGFSLDQVVVLTSDSRIPEDRRALYALRFLSGLRPGETSNARWRDLDRSKRPLWRLTLESSFNSPMRMEKATKTGASLHVPVHPVLQRMLEAWEARGFEEFMGRKPEAGDFIFPRGDGKQRLVSGTYKQFKADLETVGIATQRQYESRSTFRNLALSAGASEFHLNLITHPKPKRASDFYTRLEMQWPGMCEAVLAIDPAAWEGTPATVTSDEVTIRVTNKGTIKEKPPITLGIIGGTMEREKGFEAYRG